MFEQNFNFNNKDNETVSEELRKLFTDTSVHLTTEDYDYLGAWKNRLIELSGNN